VGDASSVPSDTCTQAVRNQQRNAIIGIHFFRSDSSAITSRTNPNTVTSRQLTTQLRVLNGHDLSHSKARRVFADCTIRRVIRGGKRMWVSSCQRTTLRRKTYSPRPLLGTRTTPRAAPSRIGGYGRPPPSSNGWCGNAMVLELISLNNGLRGGLPSLACDERACSEAARWSQGQCQQCVLSQQTYHEALFGVYLVSSLQFFRPFLDPSSWWQQYV
jgi:hypothetical protein